MIHLIGIKREIDVVLRGQLSIPSTEIDNILLKINKEILGEVVIINTCNRTEIYLNSSIEKKEHIIKEIFTILRWDKKFLEYIFYSNDDKAIIHLLQVSCGFHSKILGEDQILGQVKDAYLKSRQLRVIKGDFDRLFSMTLSCGKEFKTKTNLYKVPVSYASIAAKKTLDEAGKNIAILGFGKMAQLTFNYLVDKEIETIYILVRDCGKILDNPLLKNYLNLIEEGKIVVCPLTNIKELYKHIDTIICCTTSPTPLIKKVDLSENKISIFDLSLPINAEAGCKELANITLYNLDDLQKVDKENKLLRKEVMLDNKNIVTKYFNEYKEYLSLRKIVPMIKEIKENGKNNTNDHLKTFLHKQYTKDNEELVEKLLASSSNTYVNRAIDVLKEDTLDGDINKTYDVIRRIFLNN